MARPYSLEEIPPSAERKPFVLKDSYAAGEAEISCIHAYNAVDAQRKHTFHQDGLRFLRRVGAHLREHGVTHLSCESNPAGIAVGGEVYAHYLHQEKRTLLFLTLEPMQWGEPQSDREDCLAIRVEVKQLQDDGRTFSNQVREEQPTIIPGKTKRHKAKRLTAYVHTGPARQPLCYLNASYDSSTAARCLLHLLEEAPTRSIAYWEWLPDGSLLPSEQYPVILAQRKKERQRAESANGQWEPIVPREGEEVYQLSDSYLAPMGSRLLYKGQEQPHMSHGGEQVFLQHDFEREARAFLRALGGCLAASGYRDMRIVEYDHQMRTLGEYRVSPDPEGVKVVVQLGSVKNTGLPLRCDHLVIAAFLHPQTEEEEAEQGLPIHLGPPIRLSAGAYARQLLAALKRPLVPVPVEPAAAAPRSMTRSQKPHRTTAQEASQHDQLLFF